MGAAVGLFIESDDVEHTDFSDRIWDEIYLGADEIIVE